MVQQRAAQRRAFPAGAGTIPVAGIALRAGRSSRYPAEATSCPTYRIARTRETAEFLPRPRRRSRLPGCVRDAPPASTAAFSVPMKGKTEQHDAFLVGSDQLASVIPGRELTPISASRTRTSAATYFAYSDSSRREGRAARPPRLVAPFVADHRERDQRDVRHRVRQFDDRARHVVVRRHHDQRLEAALARPAPRLGRVAARIDGRAVEIDAAARAATGCRAASGKCRSRHWSDARPRSTAACHSRRPAIPSHPTRATSRRSTPRCRRRCAPA